MSSHVPNASDDKRHIAPDLDSALPININNFMPPQTMPTSARIPITLSNPSSHNQSPGSPPQPTPPPRTSKYTVHYFTAADIARYTAAEEAWSAALLAQAEEEGEREGRERALRWLATYEGYVGWWREVVGGWRTWVGGWAAWAGVGVAARSEREREGKKSVGEV